MMKPILFELTENPIEPNALRLRLCKESAGAFVSFEGWVRNHHQGKSVSSLTYSAHRSLALAEGQKSVEEILLAYPGIEGAAVHRLGTLALGDIAVWVGVCSAHRDQAFAACRDLIDAIKLRVPIWKHEHYQESSSAWLHPN
jgi:molybdopterin synthase catalytic subunit